MILENRNIATPHNYSQSCSDVPYSSTVDEVPGDLDLYVYLNIEMAIVPLQWIVFNRTLNPLSVVIVGSMSGGFATP